MLLHEFFGENLARFQFGSSLGRPKDREIPLIEFINDAEIERELRSDYCEVDVHTERKVGKFHDVGAFDRNTRSELSDPGISGRAEDFLDGL